MFSSLRTLSRLNSFHSILIISVVFVCNQCRLFVEKSASRTLEFEENKNNSLHYDANNEAHGIALCCIALNEEAYIDEWVDYHHALGFTSFHVYDNSKENLLKQWGNKKGDHVTVYHYPGAGKQMHAYENCANKRKQDGNNYTWVAFFDVDEFLILKKHDNVKDFLLEHLGEEDGVLSINWALFKAGGQVQYSPLPATKRFLFRDKQINQHVKSIYRLSDDNNMTRPGVHCPSSGKMKIKQHDTNGKLLHGAFNPDGPSDVAVFHHYHTKSYQEYVTKRTRGRASMTRWNSDGKGKQYEGYKTRLDAARAALEAAIENPNITVQEYGSTYAFDKTENIATLPVFDDTAWLKVKQYVPAYALFDKLP